MEFLRFLVWVAGSLIFSLRYRVKVHGLEKVRGLRGALVIPNHPGYIDPPIVLKTLWRPLRPRPMLLASMFHNPLLFWLPRVLNAVEIPDLEQASSEARQQTEKSLQAVIAGLKAGSNHILWPSGRVYRSRGRESLGAARSLAEILQAVPECKLVLVRTRGVWGSMFTYAYTGEQPRLAVNLLKGAAILLANVIFFAPRRHIEITLEVIEANALPGLTREKVNPWLDAWYNAPGEEHPAYVPYHILFGARHRRYPKPRELDEGDLSRVKQATRDAIAEIIAGQLRKEPEDQERDPLAKLEDLGLDSLDRMEISLEVERRFGFTADQVPATVGGLWLVAEGILKERALPPAPHKWFAQRRHAGRLGVIEKTMARAFVRRCIETGRLAAAADDLSGMVTYERLLVGTILLARRFARLPGKSVGVLLPASVAADTAYFALHLAGKLPVLMNWTTGPANLAHAAKVMTLTHVITSRRFVDRTGVVIAGTEYVFLEDIRGEIGKMEMLNALLRVRFIPGSVLADCPEQNEEEPAVVLFTSGSEKAPKAVPLSHRNIFSNISAALEAFHLTGNDCLVGFLPPFHSFGLTVTCILPLVCGARVVYHPDPTDASSIARKAMMYKATVLCGTPTFVGLVLNRVKPGDFDTVRLMVVGAEKCPAGLFERARALVPKAVMLEGYGITECSPVVAANLPEKSRPGSVGLPMPGVKVRVVSVEDYHPLPQGETGMLLVHGPSVFSGYIGEGGDPFTQQDGLKWYVTGDLARIDEDGFIWLAGRFKRFIKAGGEMISLPAIEEPLAQAYPAGENGPRVAVEGIETHDGRRIVLFSTEAMTPRSANEILQKAGLRGIMRIDEVRKLESIPVLGTGKTDYKVLRGMIATEMEKAENTRK